MVLRDVVGDKAATCWRSWTRLKTRRMTRDHLTPRQTPRRREERDLTPRPHNQRGSSGSQAPARPVCTHIPNSSSPSDLAAVDECNEMAIFSRVSAGLSFVLPLTVFVVAGQAAKDVAGPAGILSAILAAVVMGLHGLSCVEQSPRLWRAHCSGGAYEYTYRTGSEVVAFLVGWSEVLEHAAGSALAARAISLNINVFNPAQHDSNTTNTVVGDSRFLDMQIDLTALLIAAVVVVMNVLTADYKPVTSSWTAWLGQLALNTVILSLVLFAGAIGLHHLHFQNWTGSYLFFPHNWTGVIKGTALLYGVYTTSSRVRRSAVYLSNTTGRRSVAVSSSVSASVTCSLLISVISLTTLLVDPSSPSFPFSSSGSATAAVVVPPFPEAYAVAGLPWMKVGLAAGAVVFLVPTACIRLSSATDVIVGLANDGLLVTAFRSSDHTLLTDRVSSLPHVRRSVLRTCVTMSSTRLACILPALLTCTFALLLDVTSLALLTSLALISVHVMTSSCVLSEHYRPRDHELSRRRPSSSSRRRGRQVSVHPRNLLGDVSSLYGTTSCTLDEAGEGGICILAEAGGAEVAGGEGGGGGGGAGGAGGVGGRKEGSGFRDMKVTGTVGHVEAPDISVTTLGGCETYSSTSDIFTTTDQQRRLEVLPDVVMDESIIHFDSFVSESSNGRNLATVCGHLDDNRSHGDDDDDDDYDDESSSDTDMDDVFDEYHEQQQASVTSSIYDGDLDSDDRLLNPRCPSDVTHQQAVICTVMFVGVSLALVAMLRLTLCTAASSSVNGGYLIRAMFITFAVVFSFIDAAIFVNVLRLPQNVVGFAGFIGGASRESRSSGNSRGRYGVRFTPCLPLAAIFVSCILLVFIDYSVVVVYIVFLAPGVLVYVIYGVHHSAEATTAGGVRGGAEGGGTVSDDLRHLLPGNRRIIESGYNLLADGDY